MDLENVINIYVISIMYVRYKENNVCNTMEFLGVQIKKFKQNK